MQKIIRSLIISSLFLAFAQTSFALPLIFKTTKQVETSEPITLATIDAARLRKIRFGVKVSGASDKEVSNAEIEYKAASRNLQRATSLLESGNLAQVEFEKTKDRFDKAKIAFDAQSRKVSVFAVEGTEEILLMEFSEANQYRSFTVDSPPSKLLIKVSGKGEYKLFAWGE